jgi:hypothetical protein
LCSVDDVLTFRTGAGQARESQGGDSEGPGLQHEEGGCEQHEEGKR